MLLLSELDHQVVILLAVELNCVTDGHWQALHIQNLASVWPLPQTHHSLAPHGHGRLICKVQKLNSVLCNLALHMLQLKSHSVKSLTKSVREITQSHTQATVLHMKEFI